MAARFVEIDRDTPLILPPDLRDWVDDDDMVHFVIECVNDIPMHHFEVNHRGTGDRQYPPRMMLALLIYCYCHGTFSSRRIEKATYRDVAVRYLSADTHPDHDTICAFRRRNFQAVAAAFLRVLQLAREIGVLKVGTVSIDGTKMAANASRYQNIRYDRAGEILDTLQPQIDELLQAAETADRTGVGADENLPADLRHRQALQAKLRAAQARLEKQALAQAVKESADYQRKVDEREKRPPERKGRHPKPPATQPEPSDTSNLTDPDSRLMRKSKQHAFSQAYNAQAAVDADGSMLILGCCVSQNPADFHELIPTLHSIPDELETPHTVLADCGYCSQANYEHLREAGIDPIIPSPRQAHVRRDLDFRPPPDPDRRPEPPPESFTASVIKRLQQPEVRAKYRLRQQTVEPVFGIIRSCMGFNHFHLRGHAQVSGEWTLVSLAYNIKRLFKQLPATN